MRLVKTEVDEDECSLGSFLYCLQTCKNHGKLIVNVDNKYFCVTFLVD